MKDLELAYLAGFFDGEGSITILRNNYNRSARRGNPRYDLCVRISNQYLSILLECQKEFGGSIGGSQKCNAFYWSISSIKAYNFLVIIEPFIKIKKPQLELAKAFQEMKSRRISRVALTEDELNLYEQFQLAMKELNHQVSRVFHEKSGELLGHPQYEDNQQPSSLNDIKVGEKVHRLTGEESTNNPDTSARPERDDIVGTA